MSPARRFRLPAAVAAGVLLTVLGLPAEAHLLNVSHAGAAQGFAHPLSGLDHILAMVAVGLWAAQIGRRALWVLPLAFPLAMAAGGLLGMSAVTLPGVETGIAASVALLGLLVALAARPQLPLAIGLVALFALFHGHAHGAELPAAASPLLYGLGFVAATVVLHLTGLAIGQALKLPRGQLAVRAGGAGIAAAGAFLLLGF
ncbi:MAG TPA: HupE/UreJ family protein [Dongiaceae bacterium]